MTPTARELRTDAEWLAVLAEARALVRTGGAPLLAYLNRIADYERRTTGVIRPRSFMLDWPEQKP